MLSQFPASRTAVHDILLVDNSESLKATQAEKLRSLAERNNWKVSWTSHVEDIKPADELYTMFIAHEFFDALPFHLLQASQFCRFGQGFTCILF